MKEYIIMLRLFVAIVVFIYAVKKAKKIKWEYCGVFGFWKALFVLCGILSALQMIAIMLDKVEFASNSEKQGNLGAAVFWIIVAIITYIRARKNCPPILRKKLLISMVIYVPGRIWAFVLSLIPVLGSLYSIHYEAEQKREISEQLTPRGREYIEDYGDGWYRAEDGSLFYDGE